MTADPSEAPEDRAVAKKRRREINQDQGNTFTTELRQLCAVSGSP
jgi:hypothetical protein